MAQKVKYLTSAGVARLWAAIEQKFIDTNELTVNVGKLIDDSKTEIDAISNEDLDNITGFINPVESFADVSALLNDRTTVEAVLKEEATFANVLTVGEGKTLTLHMDSDIVNEAQYAILVDGGKLIIDGDGEVAGAGRALYATNGGEIEVNGGTYTSTSAGQCIAANGEGSKVVINDAVINAQEAGLMAFYGGEIDINGGEINTIDNFGVGTNGSLGQGGNVINLKNVKINGHITSNGYVACGIYAANNDTIIVGEGTEIVATNGCGICQRGGTVIVKAGAKIKTTWDGTVAEGGVGDRKKNFGADGIVFDEEGMYPTPSIRENHYPMHLVVEQGVIFDIAEGYENVHIFPDAEITPNVELDVVPAE